MNMPNIIVQVLLVLSVAAFWFPLVLGIISIVKNQLPLEKRKRPLLSKTMIFSLAVLLSIFFLRFALAMHKIYVLDEPAEFNWLAEIPNSFLNALRTFNLEEQYLTFLDNVESMATALSSEKSLLYWYALFHATALHIAAPIAGGMIILEVLSTLYPVIAVKLSFWSFFQDRCYFSELNSASLALAKGISTYYTKTLHKMKPVLIFADAYVDDAKETENELLLEAKRIGAICIRDDICYVNKYRSSRSKYFLIDEDEFVNMQTLMSLAERRNVDSLKKAQIYLFVGTDAYVQTEKNVRAILTSKKRGKKALKNDELPLIVPVNSYRNLIQNLFVEVPLYEPIVHDKSRTKLNVTVLGNGIIGTEAFLNAYWFGQMMVSRGDTMEECELCINVISKDSEKVFLQKIDYINPEIAKSGEAKNKILEYAENKFNNPYFTVNYEQADVKFGGFWTGAVADMIYDSDYIIVALGNDADNISVAQKLGMHIGKKHLEKNDGSKTVIAYAVFDPLLSKALNKRKHFQSCRKDKTDIYMHAFGSLNEVYSSDNIFMSKNVVWANEIGNAYLKSRGLYNYIADNKSRPKDEDRNYTHWSDLARAMHLKYKVFSLGWINTSVFDHTDEEMTEQLHRAAVKAKCAEFKRVAITNGSDGSPEYADIEKKKHALAWLEHRRWCAFARTMGYMYTDATKTNYELYGKHKNMSLKLHPCIREGKMPVATEKYIHAEFGADGKIDRASAFLAEASSHDSLDRLSYEWRTLVENGLVKALADAIASKDSKKLFELIGNADIKRLESILEAVSSEENTEDLARKIAGICITVNDFKTFDYYRYEFDDYLTSEEVAEKLEKCNKLIGKIISLRLKRSRLVLNGQCFYAQQAAENCFKTKKEQRKEQMDLLAVKNEIGSHITEFCSAQGGV